MKTLHIATIVITWARSIDSWEHSVYYGVYYSPDGGLAWTMLEMDTWNNYFEWGLDSSINGTYLIKIIAYAVCGLMTEDISGSFNVSRYDHEDLGTPDVLIQVVAIGIVGVIGIAALAIVLKRRGSLQ